MPEEKKELIVVFGSLGGQPMVHLVTEDEPTAMQVADSLRMRDYDPVARHPDFIAVYHIPLEEVRSYDSLKDTTVEEVGMIERGKSAMSSMLPTKGNA